MQTQKLTWNIFPISPARIVCSIVMLHQLLYPLKDLTAEPVALTAESVVPFHNTVTTSSTTTTVPFVCEYSEIQANLQQATFNEQFNYVQSGQNVPSCIYAELYQIYKECNDWGRDTSRPIAIWHIYRNLIDDCVAWRVFGAANNVQSQAAYGNSAHKYYWGAQHPWAALSQNTSACYGPFGCFNNTSKIYIKQSPNSASCSAVPTVPQNINACYAGIFNWQWSPISLLWDEYVDTDHDLKITSFPIDLQNPDHFTLWKASAKAPLLVYDPTHLGKIESATQLFGDWTFGGKKIASLHLQTTDALPFTPRTTKWSSGYEALGSLDLNADKKISGQELASLGLWFDENRDGHSDEGEVKSLNDVGVISLYYEPNRIDPMTNSIYADRGFERISNGKIIRGGSVDWRSDTAPSKEELLNRYISAGSTYQETTGSLYTAKDNSASVFTINSSLPSTGQVAGLSGIWEWRITDKGHLGSSPGGFLIINQLGDHNLSGHSYTTFATNNIHAGFTHLLSSAAIAGESESRRDGTHRISFRVYSQDTSNISSEAILSTDHKTLFGHTKAEISFGTKATDISYSWIAKRVFE